MEAEAKKARAEYMKNYMPEYMKKWRKNNPEKAREIRERYWKKKADQAKADDANE